ncbi:MAG: ABC transporter ATP-binding protein [Actinobacteria bacterium]|nr:ABC transporter ATP-binding protein [Actinomycetota bacterium]
MAAVEVENLSVHYGPLRAVDEVSFTAESGEITAVLGPNGAGKTSTIETCEGFRRPTSGAVRVLDLDPWAQRTALHREVGVMLQDGGVYPSARVGETVAQFCRLYDRGAMAGELVARVGLVERTTTTWRRLSGGEKQRLCLALALAARPRVAFLDEPTAGIDVNGRDDVRGIIRDLAGQGCAVVLATHELDEAERLADRVVLFNRGRIVANSTLANLRSSRTTVRFRSSPSLDAQRLAQHIGLEVVANGDEFIISFSSPDSSMASDLVSRISVWLGSNSFPLHDLNVGGERLEDVFRMLTKEQGP